MTVGIIGTGIMGSGIAQIFAMNDNYSVYLCDLTEELTEKGKNKIDKDLSRLVKKETFHALDQIASENCMFASIHRRRCCR